MRNRNSISIWRKLLRRPRKRPSSVTKHFTEYREIARKDITASVEYWNQFYQFSYGRITIRNQRRRWGSCSSLGNLNFNYKLIFLPEALKEYVVVHELCHLHTLNHSQAFWSEVARAMPEYQTYQSTLREIERTYGTSIAGLIKAQAHYQAHTTTPRRPCCDAAPTRSPDL